MLTTIAGLAALASITGAATVLPFEGKMRGVNLGGLFVFEVQHLASDTLSQVGLLTSSIVQPWMAWDTWTNTLNCSDVEQSEWGCMEKYINAGQRELGERAFLKHWQEFITEQDIIDISKMGLNTVRIPLCA